MEKKMEITILGVDIELGKYDQILTIKDKIESGDFNALYNACGKVFYLSNYPEQEKWYKKMLKRRGKWKKSRKLKSRRT